MERRGASVLSDGHLLGLLFPRNGSAGARADEAVKELLRAYPSLAEIDRASLGELLRLKGMGRVTAARVKAAFELGRRLVAGGGERKVRFGSSREVAGYFRPFLLNRRREIFIAALLNGRHRLMREVTVSVGCLTSSIVHPREVFAPALRDSAAAVIFVHNHPSGDPTPSEEDLRLTERLVEAGKLLGIKVLDHVVVARGGYVSLLDGRQGRR
jgi:DNA repair protein RadC